LNAPRISVGNGSFPPLLKWPGRETNYTSQYSNEMGLYCKSVPPYAFVACTVTILPP
jgi:hypothetical protein